MGPLFKVSEPSAAASSLPAERTISMVEPPPRAVSLADIDSMPEDEEEVESDASSAAPPLEVFMPPGDMEAARRMAIAYIDSLPALTSPAAAIAEAISAELPGLHVTMVPSSLGDMYAKFLSPEDHEIAIEHQAFFLDGATIRLVREEEANHIPCDMQFVAFPMSTSTTWGALRPLLFRPNPGVRCRRSLRG
jgi:hypothetical protein